MKTLVIALSIFLAGGICLADVGLGEVEPPEGLTEDTTEPKTCPATRFSDNGKCMDCHAMVLKDGKPSFGLKEVSPTEKYDSPYELDIVVDGDRLTPYILWGGITPGTPNRFKEAMEYIEWHPELGKRIVIEIHSTGGSLLDAWRIVGLMDYYKASGYVFETRCSGMAMSAGFLLFANGNKGHRLVNPRAEFMWHELWTFAFLKVETPSKKEHEAEVLRHLQDNIHEWMSGRSNKSKEDLDSFVEFKEYWVNGQEMIDGGFADEALGESR